MGEFSAQLPKRHRVGRVWFLFFLSATIIGIIALMALLYTIIVQSFGLVAIENKIDPATLGVAGMPLERLDRRSSR